MDKANARAARRSVPQTPAMAALQAVLLVFAGFWLWLFAFVLFLGQKLVGRVRTKMQRFDSYHTIPQLVAMQGYECETHQVTTGDGYILTMFRILPSSPQPTKTTKNPKTTTTTSTPTATNTRPVVLLWHGLLDSSYTYTFLDKQSLAFSLCDRGFDVWLGNNRGNVYSRAHTFLCPKSDEKFWRFSWDEFAAFDLPDCVRFVCKTARVEKLAYVGHSEGTMQMFAKLCADPNFAQNISCFVALGPVASVSNIHGVFRVLANCHIDTWFWFLGMRSQFFTPNSWMQTLSSWLCALFPKMVDDCLRILCGIPAQPLDPSKLCDWGQHEPGGTSTMNVIHFAQGLRCPQATSNPQMRFCMFDHGRAENLRRYKQPTPPIYDLSQFPTSLPVLLCCGGRDTLANPRDVQWLRLNLPVRANVQCVVLDTFNHTDFMWSPEAPTVLYPQIFSYFETHAVPLISTVASPVNDAQDGVSHAGNKANDNDQDADLETSWCNPLSQ